MLRRRRLLVASVLAALASQTAAAGTATAATAPEIGRDADTALERLYAENPAARALGEKAVGILIFPKVVNGGFGIGGEYGEGILRKAGQPAGYYNLISASFGFQIGAQAYSEVLFFMSEEALGWLDRTYGLELGVDGSVALAGSGAGGELDSASVANPIVAFVFGQQGLMANATIEGSKISRIER
ncbi:MAG: YSC84-related protein [Geminicoccaceae bacterium]